MPALRVSFVLLVAACTPRAGAPQIIEHPLGESTAPGPVRPPPLAREVPRREVHGGLLTGAPTAPTPASSLSPGAVAPPTSTPGAAEAQQPVAAGAQQPVAAEAQYTGGTESTVVQEPNARIPSTPSGVASETTTGTPSGVTAPSSAEPSTPSSVPDTTGAPASTVPSGTPDVPATGVLTPPPPSEP